MILDTVWKYSLIAGKDSFEFKTWESNEGPTFTSVSNCQRMSLSNKIMMSLQAISTVTWKIL